MFINNFLGNLAYKLWDRKEGGVRLAEMKNLTKLEYSNQDELDQYQRVRLIRLIENAYKYSSWYRNMFDESNLKPSDFRCVDDLQKLPLTFKSDIRDNPAKFISEAHDESKLVSAKTGGSTGVSLNLYFDQYCQKLRNAAQGYADHIAGWLPGDKIASLWGNPPIALSVKQKIRSQFLERTIYLDTMNLNPKTMTEFIRRWQKTLPDMLFGHSHSIYIFSKYLLDNNIRVSKPKGIITTSMMLLDHERTIIEEVFGVKVNNRYGCEEVGLIASECEVHKGMHINSPHIVLECVDDNGHQISSGEPGKLVVTDLNNFAMPLIRYQIEDAGVLSNKSCPCGRVFPLLDKLEGRVADFLKKLDGSLVGGVSLVERTLTKVAGIEQMQLIQRSLYAFEINRIKGREFTIQTDVELVAELTLVFSDEVNFIINDITSIPQEESGKYRFSICDM